MNRHLLLISLLLIALAACGPLPNTAVYQQQPANGRIDWRKQ